MPRGRVPRRAPHGDQCGTPAEQAPATRARRAAAANAGQAAYPATGPAPPPHGDGMHLDLVTAIVEDCQPAIAFFAGTLGFGLVADSPSLTGDGRAKRWVVVRPRSASRRPNASASRPTRSRAATWPPSPGRVPWPNACTGSGPNRGPVALGSGSGPGRAFSAPARRQGVSLYDDDFQRARAVHPLHAVEFDVA